MKWCRMEAGGRAAYAIAEGDELFLLEGSPLGEHRRTGQRCHLDEVRLLPPVAPSNFYAAGTNFRFHIEWAKQYHRMSGLKIPEQADVGYRSPSALVGSGDEIVIPADSRAERDALGCVAGYTLGNDLSERAWQLSDRTLWRAKNTDTFKPMGPFVVEGIDPMAQTIGVRINGHTVSEYNTSGMLFSVAHWISRISRYSTLYPGDVLWLGCDGATLPALQPGNFVEVFNQAIGVLANRVVRGES